MEDTITDTNVHPPIDHYCAAVFELTEDRIPTSQSNIAKRLGISRTSVFEMLNRLEKEDIIIKDKNITLTKKGLTHAKKIVAKHRLAERFLAEVMKLSWEEAHSEAGKWEHVISSTVQTRMEEMLGDPATCPRGNPIPGKAEVSKDERSLSELLEDQEFTVTRITESIETIPGELTRLYVHNVVPKAKGKVISIIDGEFKIEIAGKKVLIPIDSAKELKVI